MKHLRRVAIGLLLVSLLVTVPWGCVFVSNAAMITLARCWMPIGRVSYPDRPNPPATTQPLPEAACLNAVRQLTAQGDTRVQARMALLDGDMAAGQGEWLTAIEHYRQAAALIAYPTPDIWNTVSVIYMMNLRDPLSALTVTLQALRQSPDHQGLRTCAAELYLFYVPPYGDAVSALDAMQPDLGFTHPYPYYLAAVAYLQIGKLPEGLQMAEKAVQLGRAYGGADLANALYILGVLQRCTDQDKAGLANLSQAQEIEPDASYIQAALSDDFRSLCGPVTLRQ